MTTGIDILEKDKGLQGHWLLRTAAYLIDFVIFYTIFWFFALLNFSYFWVHTIAAGMMMFLYCIFMETSHGGTIGKLFLGMRTVSFTGPLDVQKTAIRNIAKIMPVLLVFDVALGLATEGDPRQKYTDRISGTLVVEEKHLSSPDNPSTR